MKQFRTNTGRAFVTKVSGKNTADDYLFINEIIEFILNKIVEEAEKSNKFVKNSHPQDLLVSILSTVTVNMFMAAVKAPDKAKELVLLKELMKDITGVVVGGVEAQYFKSEMEEVH